MAQQRTSRGSRARGLHTELYIDSRLSEKVVTSLCNEMKHDANCDTKFAVTLCRSVAVWGTRVAIFAPCVWDTFTTHGHLCCSVLCNDIDAPHPPSRRGAAASYFRWTRMFHRLCFRFQTTRTPHRADACSCTARSSGQPLRNSQLDSSITVQEQTALSSCADADDAMFSARMRTGGTRSGGDPQGLPALTLRSITCYASQLQSTNARTRNLIFRAVSRECPCPRRTLRSTVSDSSHRTPNG